MRITVYEEVSHTANVTREALVAYVEKAGWLAIAWSPGVRAWRKDFTVVLSASPTEKELREAIEIIALVESRQPHLVLADVAALVETQPQ